MHAAESLQPAFRALADPTRRQILSDLARADRTVGAVASRFSMTRAAVRKHLTVLEEGGLISITAEGREKRVALAPANLKAAHDWLGAFSQYWDDRLAALKTAVETDPTPTPEGDDP